MSNSNTCHECMKSFSKEELKNGLCKSCDSHPFDMDINDNKNMSLEDAFDSILKTNFVEYKNSEPTKTKDKLNPNKPIEKPKVLKNNKKINNKPKYVEDEYDKLYDDKYDKYYNK